MKGKLPKNIDKIKGWNKNLHTSNYGNGFKLGHIPWNKDKKLGPNPEHSQKLKGRKLSEEHRKKVIKTLTFRFKKGNVAWNKNKKGEYKILNRKTPPPFTEEHKNKIRIATQKRVELGIHNFQVMSGENHSLWKDGISKKKGYYTFLSKRRRIRKLGNGGTHTLSQWEELKMQCGYMCLCCKITEPEITLTEDHIIPLVKGGSDDISNIQPLCGSCNSRKHFSIINYKDLIKII